MTTKKKELIVLAQSLEQPRVVKRIIEKSIEYNKVTVYGFTRKLYTVNNYAILNEYKNISVNIVASVTDNKYMARIMAYVKLLWIIYKNHGLKRKTLYVFGLDFRIISSLIFNTKIDYEISDIMWLYKSPFQKKVFEKIDTFLAKYSNTVTYTSQGFYDTHYKNHVKLDNVIIKENKFKSYGKVKPINTMPSDKIRIAHIGALRYDNVIKRLLDVIKDNNELILNFYGDGQSSIVTLIKEYAQEYDNITFNGAFKNPDDLERIYEENNVNFVVYNNTMHNEKIAMPNKFYESGFFNIPIVCATDTYVGQRVLEQEMGWTVDITFEAISSFLNTLQMNEIVECHNRITQLDKSLFSC